MWLIGHRPTPFVPLCVRCLRALVTFRSWMQCLTVKFQHRKIYPFSHTDSRSTLSFTSDLFCCYHHILLVRHSDKTLIDYMVGVSASVQDA